MQRVQPIQQLEKSKRLILFCVLIVTFFSFLSTLSNQFTNWDDPGHLLENHSIRSLSAGNIVDIFKEKGVVNRTYIPLALFSFAIEYHFFKYNPFIYHLTNLILHLGVVALIFLFGLRCGLSAKGAGFAALIFGIHPMHVESVAWVTERKDVLCALFYLLALNSYCKYISHGGKALFIKTLVFVLLSVLSKAMALSLPLVFFLCDWFKGRRVTINTIVEKVICFLIIVPVVWVTYVLNSAVFFAGGNFAESVLVLLWTFTFYIKKFIFPVSLSPVYSLSEPVSLLNPSYSFSFFMLCFFIFVLIRFRRNKWILFAFLFYFLSIFFLLRSHVDFEFEIVADRFMYLPSIGFCLLVGFIFERGQALLINKPARAKHITIFFLVVLCAGMSFKTNLQCRLWKDSISLWSGVISNKGSKKALAYYNRGNAYDEEGKYALAIEDYSKAIEINSKYFKAYVNRGVIYHDMGEHGFAVNDYNKTIKILLALFNEYKNKFYENKEAGRNSAAFHYYRLVSRTVSDLSVVYANRAIIFDFVRRKEP